MSLNTAHMGRMKRSLLSLAVASMGLGLGAGGHAQNLDLQSNARPQNSQEDRFALNFVNAEIDAVVRAIGSFTNQTFVVDPRVRGTISLVSPEPLSAKDAKNALLAALRLQGFTIVESGGVARVLPENDAKVQANNTVDPRRAMSQSGNAIVTQVFQLNYESATALVPVLRPLIAPNNTIAAYPNNNTLVITDYADNLQRIARIIASIDGPYSGDLEVVPLEHALAVDLAAILGRMLDEGNRGTGAAVDAGQRLSVMADPRTNSLLLRTPSKARLNLAKALIAKLDQPTKQPGNVWVVYLKNAEAAKLAKTLQAVLSSSPISENSNSGLNQLSSGGGLAGGLTNDNPNNNNSTRNVTNGSPGLGSSALGGSSSGQLSSASGNVELNNGGIVQADPSTNSLIITAPEPIYRNLRSIIEKLDVRRAQVFVESLIVEVSTDKAAEFGIQFQGLSGVGANGVRVIGGTNFNAPGSGANILGAATNLGSVGRGLNIGVIDGQVNIPGIGTISNLGFLARALESKANANILSTPNILTLDNEEAKIVIGQNVPFITGQFTNSGGNGATVNPFQTIERQDVGLTLRVKPQVSEGGIVKLGIFQEVSSVVDSTNVSGIITNKRSIESNVLVESGNIIVLGGLVEDRVTGNEEKVPGLGDVPVLGQFFRYDNRRRQKTNLMVFLRPVVVRNEDQAQGIVTNRYDYMRQLQRENQPEQRFGLPNMEAPVLPTRRPQAVAPAAEAAPAKTTPGEETINLTPSNKILVIPRPGQASGDAEVGPNGGRIIRGKKP
ncbi:MAG: type II secretion system secretin GspD [Limnobacter sp.]|uniref:type II secretion system secretin GspD n=1 Tax=Limnobacter TaxID=131079 RepID=UPI0022C2E46E|nr:type II secretion system secretin GspD [Limnobacter sp.]MCZ8016429.1 type II secretion system secretin GspD [Limnobacter sp.]